MSETNVERLKSRSGTAYDEVMDLLMALGFTKTAETRHHISKMRLEWWDNGSHPILLEVSSVNGSWHAFGDLTPSVSLAESLTDISRYVSESVDVKCTRVAHISLTNRKHLEEEDVNTIIFDQSKENFIHMMGERSSMWKLPRTDEDTLSMLLNLGEKRASRKLVDLLKKLIKLRYEYVMFE